MPFRPEQRAITGAAALAAVRFVDWAPADFAAHVDEAMAIYVKAMGYLSQAGPQRAVSARRHVHHAGFAARAALAGDGQLIGFGYGYTTAPGQWWHDLVQAAIGPVLAAEWLRDAFELSELHVLPAYQGQRIGRVLLTGLAAGLPQRAMLLSTPDSDTRAFRMYHHLGFTDLRRDYIFPGDGRRFAVLGTRLPLLSR